MTIRAIIGTIAVLAGFAVLERSVDASTGYAGSCQAGQAYALLHPGEAIAVRAQPTPEGAVIGEFTTAHPDGPVASAVTLDSSRSGWARIVLASAAGFTPRNGGASMQFGWIPADQLEVGTKIDGAITTYTRPGLMGRQVSRIEGDDLKFRVLGCRGSWLQVINERHGNIWIDRWCGREEGCRS
ncbi:MAG: hypothetical protein KIT25_20095 [Enhydrobacter sp.]|nr:MAG: hypothetical protein KIT25_20095 [Enhydrobacter sp.]